MIEKSVGNKMGARLGGVAVVEKRYSRKTRKKGGPISFGDEHLGSYKVEE